MRDREIAKLSMVSDTISFIEATAAETASIPAIATTNDELKDKRDELQDANLKQGTLTTGVTSDKNEVKENLIQDTLAIAGKVFSFATDTNNTILKEQMDINISLLRSKKDDELAEFSNFVHGKANDNIASLAPYAVVAQTLTDFMALITGFQTKAPAPRLAISQRKGVTDSVPLLFKEADNILKKLDKLMLTFKKSNPILFNGYNAVREIVDIGSVPTQVNGTTKHSVTNDPLDGVEVKATKDNIKFYTILSVTNGTYSLKIPIPGVYTLTFTKPGFQTKQVINVIVVLGQTTIMEVTLIPE